MAREAVTREERLAQAFIDLADTLVHGFDMLDLLLLLSERCVDVLEVAAAGVMLAGEAGELHLVAASDESLTVLETFEAQQGEGPCFDAYVTVDQVVAPDLGQAGARWPNFAPKAMEAGFRSAFGFPLRLRGDCIGALNLFNTEASTLDEADTRVGQALADAATIAILQARVLRESRDLGGQLQSALDSRVVIEQAKGILSHRLSIGMGEAFERLRRQSQEMNLPLREVARQVVDGTLAPDA